MCGCLPNPIHLVSSQHCSSGIFLSSIFNLFCYYSTTFIPIYLYYYELTEVLGSSLVVVFSLKKKKVQLLMVFYDSSVRLYICGIKRQKAFIYFLILTIFLFPICFYGATLNELCMLLE